MNLFGDEPPEGRFGYLWEKVRVGRFEDADPFTFGLPEGGAHALPIDATVVAGDFDLIEPSYPEEDEEGEGN